MNCNNLRILCLIALFLLFGVNSLFAATQAAAPENLTIDQWVGQKFVFLALPNDRQSEGYEIYPEELAERGFSGDRSVNIAYKDYFAKQVTVTDVVRITDTPYDYVVHLREAKSGQKLIGRTFRGQLEGLALIDDREKARKKFVGKTIYALSRTLQSLEPGNDTMPEKAINISPGTPLQVIDIWDGMQSSYPIWLVVLINGHKAVLPIAYSWTNQPGYAWTTSPPWQDYISLEDPGKLTKSYAELQSFLESGTIKEGMTQYQVRLIWGPPSSIEKAIIDGSEQILWTYGNQKLKFSGDRLVSIEIMTASE